MPSTLGTMKNLKLLASHIYSQDEIDNFDIREAIENHPVAHRLPVDAGPPSKFALRDPHGSHPASDLVEYGGRSGVRTDQWFHPWHGFSPFLLFKIYKAQK